MKKKQRLLCVLLCAIICASSVGTLAVTSLASAYSATGNYLYNIGTPTIGSTGGDWIVIGLTRSGRALPESYKDSYYQTVAAKLEATSGVLDSNKYTEYSRVIISLTSIGKDVTNVSGYNLLEYLANYKKVLKQGLNGPIWALIALDSHDYAIPSVSDVAELTTREKLIDYILGKQLSTGGWNLECKDSVRADPDMTGMAIQSLAPYYNSNSAVKTAVDRALSVLSGIQQDNGGFDSWGTSNSESICQVIVALGALGIDANTDSRFVKPGGSLFDALLTFYDPSVGAFRHILNDGVDGMATEQAYYAMVSYYRVLAGKTPLYRMSDVAIADASVDLVAMGDINGNGIINAEDLAKLLLAYGSSDESADLTGDGIVNAADLSKLLKNYGTKG